VLNVIHYLLFAALALFRTRSRLAMEILALRHQLGVLQRSAKRPRLTNVDRGLWVLLSRRWCRWKDALVIVKPATVIQCCLETCAYPILPRSAVPGTG
jgi:putative transposase